MITNEEIMEELKDIKDSIKLSTKYSIVAFLSAIDFSYFGFYIIIEESLPKAIFGISALIILVGVASYSLYNAFKNLFKD